MTIRYELNPPKVKEESLLSHEDLENALQKLKERVLKIEKLCHGIHITDSVLGIPRISPITTGALIRNHNSKMEITVSLRVRDRNLTSLVQSISDAILLGLNGILILKGDPPPEGPKDSKLVPSQVVKYFKQLNLGEKIDLFLSLPSNPNFDKIHNKIEAKPTGFVTQVIHSVEQVSRIVDYLKPQGFKIIPCVLLPSKENAPSAKYLNLDWSSYNDNPIDFIKEIHKIAGDVLITSPNDFNGAYETFTKLAS